jgi:hypothetical protein
MGDAPMPPDGPPPDMDPIALLEIAESCEPTDELWEDVQVVELESKTTPGWKVVFFYDACYLDYIEYFINPVGAVIDPWQWPDCPERQIIIDWGKVGDLAELRGRLANAKKTPPART